MTAKPSSSLYQPTALGRFRLLALATVAASCRGYSIARPPSTLRVSPVT